MTKKEQPFKKATGQVERATHDPAEDVEREREKAALEREKAAVERDRRETTSDSDDVANDHDEAADADRTKAKAMPISAHNER